MATSYLEIGYTYFNRGHSRCINYFRKAMRVLKKLGYGHYIANTHLNIASYFVDVNQIDSAEYHLSRAMAVATDQKLPVTYKETGLADQLTTSVTAQT